MSEGTRAAVAEANRRLADRGLGAEEWVTIPELAAELKISPRTIRNRRSLGTLGLRGYKVGGLVRFKRRDVALWLESSADGGGAAA